MSSSITIPTPFASGRAAVHQLGLSRRQPASGLRDQAGRGGRHLAEAGETSNEYIAWSAAARRPYNPSPLVYGDYYYTLLDRGFLTVPRRARPARRSTEGPAHRPTARAAFTASPWAYNGKVFALSEDGDTFVIQAGPEYKVLGKNSLDEMTLATPAIARGSLIIRTASRLYRIRQQKETER